MLTWLWVCLRSTEKAPDDLDQLAIQVFLEVCDALDLEAVRDRTAMRLQTQRRVFRYFRSDRRDAEKLRELCEQVDASLTSTPSSGAMMRISPRTSPTCCSRSPRAS